MHWKWSFMIILEDLSLPCPMNRLWSPKHYKIVKSKEGGAKEKRMVEEIRQKLGGFPEPITVACTVSITWWPWSLKKQADVDAYVKSTLDALTKARVYLDDALVDSFTCERMTHTKPRGKLTVTVSEL